MAGRPPPLPPRAVPATALLGFQESQPSFSAPERTSTVHLTPEYRSPSQSSRHSSDTDGPPPPYEELWNSHDPRSSSMQSLVPIESGEHSRRKLLLIYIHGFMGNETSFRSYPAHVHNLLTVTMEKTHVVHTKIYPRYKSRKTMDIARDNFSNWLCPHESPTTDVILFGHSLGGILAAEVALLPAHSTKSPEIRQHRILGVVAIDTPFLGMHPGVITTGLGSLFRPAPEIPQPSSLEGSSLSTAATTTSSLLSPSDSIISDPFSPPIQDPNFNPPFANDVISPQRKFWESAIHFVNKHSDGLSQAATQYVKSHLDFGGVMVDYPGLKNRYEHVRALEDIDESLRRRDPGGRLYRRVRFVNYYSASTGRLKPGRGNTVSSTISQDALGTEMQDMSLRSPSEGHSSGYLTPSSGPRLSLEEHTDEGLIPREMDDSDELNEMDQLEPSPMDEMTDEENPSNDVNVLEEQSTRHEIVSDEGHSNTVEETSAELPSLEEEASKELSEDSLPPLPPIPSPPEDFDPSKYTSKDVLKIAQKEHDRQVKGYERAKKDREKSIREREKMIEKARQKAKKEMEKKARDREKMIEKRKKLEAKQEEKEVRLAKKQLDTDERERLKRSATLNPEAHDKQVQTEAAERGVSEQHVRKKQKDRKFCSLPSKDPKTGIRDPCWIRVYMEGVDEVVAHTTLFSGVGEAYEKLVGDTVSRVEQWVAEDMSKRADLGEKGN